ncbi:MAG: hypothetical protein ACRCSG_07240 [Cellulosilyticaceae bacterium]
MDIISATMSFIMVITIYLIISEIFTVLFRLTGMTQEKARFQVISMLTGSGFTTSESELITNSKTRRRLAKITMIFGYSFTVTIVSMIVNIVIGLPQAEIKSIWAVLLIIAPFIGIIICLFKVTSVRKIFENMIENIASKLITNQGINSIMILESYGNSVMAEVHLKLVPKILEEISLADAQLNAKHGIKLILIKRKGQMITEIVGDTKVMLNDKVIVFGNYKTIRQIFQKELN